MPHIHSASVFYVSPSQGDDKAFNGLSPLPDKGNNGPFQSLQQALTAVKNLRRKDVLRPVTVALTEDVFIEEPLVLDQDNVTLTSAQGQKRIIGGICLKQWKKDMFNGVECLSATLPERTGAWDFTDLYVNGAPAEAPRYPATSTLRALATEHDCTDLHTHSKWFIANKKDLEGVQGIENALVHYYHYWVDEHSPVEDYNPETGKLTLAYASRFSINTLYDPPHTGALNYYLTNIPTAFGAPNQWFLDRKKGIVYYKPETPSVETVEAYVPLTSSLLTVTGKHVQISNLNFSCCRGDYASRCENCTETVSNALPKIAYGSDGQSVCSAPGAIIFDRTENCAITCCEIENVGIHAVEIRPGCKNIRVEKNHLHHLAAGGIKIIGGEAGCGEEQRTAFCTVRKNHIHHCGLRYAAGCGILVCHAAHNDLSENEIHHLDYTGISVGWVWGYGESNTYANRICGNHIHHIGMGLLSDMGGIYLLGKQPGTLVAYNRIHHVTAANYGAWGIYTDEGSSYITIKNNVVFNTRSGSFHQHYGACNLVQNNIFAFGGNALQYTKKEQHEGLIAQGNLMITRGRPIYGKNVAQAVASSSNLFWDYEGKIAATEELTLEQWQKDYGKDEGSIVADPLFTDPENGNFTLPKNSPAIQIGFRPIEGFPAKER